jgi:hypothetical protein
VTKRIPLTQGFSAIVDASNFAALSSVKWTAATSCGKTYAIRRSGPQRQWMHRVVCPAPTGVEVDHINGDTLDNRRSNLRHATKAQQQHNSKMRSHNKSGFKGVILDHRNGHWMAKIVVAGKLKHAGSFPAIVEAARAYDSAAKKHFGEFARTNF